MVVSSIPRLRIHRRPRYDPCGIFNNGNMFYRVCQAQSIRSPYVTPFRVVGVIEFPVCGRPTDKLNCRRVQRNRSTKHRKRLVAVPVSKRWKRSMVGWLVVIYSNWNRTVAWSYTSLRRQRGNAKHERTIKN